MAHALFYCRLVVYYSQINNDGAEGPAVPYPMGVHEALEAWQQGEITYRRTLRLVGVDTIADLYAAARSSGIEIRIEPTTREIHLSDEAIRLIDRELDRVCGRVLPPEMQGDQ